LQPVDRERIIPWVYDASIHAIALTVINGYVWGSIAYYTVQAPGGAWDASDAGRYTVTLADG
jgi:hypothetical protein